MHHHLLSQLVCWKSINIQESGAMSRYQIKHRILITIVLSADKTPHTNKEKIIVTAHDVLLTII